uniref:Uncharacterized protein n=1 Tax=Anguilla anguilla TaxID=7936 RepID=A0A0E9SHE4_ANGAN
MLSNIKKFIYKQNVVYKIQLK